MKTASIPLQITARVLSPAMIILSLVILYRGHHLPGGGFIGGLVCAAGFGLIAIGNGLAAARRALRVQPVSLVIAGLATATLSGLVGPLVGGTPIFGAAWLPSFHLPVLGTVHLGTPILFDVGVYLAVMGFTLTCLFALIRADSSSFGMEGIR